MSIYKKKEQAEQENNTNSKVWGEKKLGGWGVGNRPKTSAQGDKSKEKPDSSWNKGSCDLRVRPHPDNLPTCENELKKSLSSEGSHQEEKANIIVILQGAKFQPHQAA